MTKRVEEPIMTIEKPSPSKARFIDFSAEREEWNKYVVEEDDTIIRAKFLLTGAMVDKTMEGIMKEAKNPRGKLRIGFSIKSQNVFAVESPPRLRGPSDSRRYSVEELRASIVKPGLDFKTTSESWNSYLFENGMRMKAKLSPTSISRTNKFDSGGIPVYVLDFTIDLVLNLPDQIENILKKRKKSG